MKERSDGPIAAVTTYDPGWEVIVLAGANSDRQEVLASQQEMLFFTKQLGLTG